MRRCLRSRWQIGRHPSVGTIDYTAFNLPKRTLGTASSPATEYLYDAFGRRASKRASAGGSRTVYVDRIYERRIEGEIAHVMYVYADDRLVVQLNRSAGGAEEFSYVYSDDMGSPHVIEGPGAVRAVSKRDPFGNHLPAGANNFVDDIRLSAAIVPPGGGGRPTKGFTGHEIDTELGLVNMRGRIYDPRTARFLQTDPLVSSPFASQAHNRYSYVLNNPTAFVGPSGFQSEPIEVGTVESVNLVESRPPAAPRAQFSTDPIAFEGWDSNGNWYGPIQSDTPGPTNLDNLILSGGPLSFGRAGAAGAGVAGPLLLGSTLTLNLPGLQLAGGAARVAGAARLVPQLRSAFAALAVGLALGEALGRLNDALHEALVENLSTRGPTTLEMGKRKSSEQIRKGWRSGTDVKPACFRTARRSGGTTATSGTWGT